MKRFRVYQTMYLGEVEVPDGLDADAVIDWMNENDRWPEDFLEPVDTLVFPVVEDMEAVDTLK